MFLKHTLYAALLTVIALISLAPQLNAQTTKVTGMVFDGDADEPLPFVNVYFAGTTSGTTTDIDGKFVLESADASDKIVAQFLGYLPDTLPVVLGQEQTIDFKLGTTAMELEEVVVSVTRYKKKNNPAVELIKKVIKNKKKNSLKDLSHYQYDKYEKIELDLNNITEKFMNRRAFKKFQFIFDYVDTSEVNGKAFLPIYLQETASTVYYRKSPSTTREHQTGVKLTELEGAFDASSMQAVMGKLYEDIDINKNNIDFLTYQFVSPLSIIAPDFYRFYLGDTIMYNGHRVIDLEFYPRNQLDLGFHGHLYITDDDVYKVIRVEMDVLDGINLNFVQDVKIEQEFELIEGEWVRSKDFLLIDYSITKKGMGMFGSRSVTYNNFQFNKPAPDKKYAGTEKVVVSEDAFKQTESFWEENRLDTLTEQEKGVYVMMDTLQRVPAFRRTVKLLGLLFSGYTDIGPIDVGPINSFYSFNDVEGFRMRLGGRTNLKFNQKIQLEAYGAFGFRDKLPKYYGAFTYSFNDNFEKHPRHYFKASYLHEVKFPGQILEYITEDNFLLSFKRGRQDNMMFFTAMRGDYYLETRNNVVFRFSGQNRRHKPHPNGSLEFVYSDQQDKKILPEITTTEFNAGFQFSPNAKYFNSKNFRYNIVNKYPVIKLDYTLGLNALGGDYEYHKAKINVFKRFYLSILGYTNVEVEAGKLFGKNVPYILLYLPRANQTFSYQNRAYNLMNYLEFISDEFVSVNVRHYFQGFFFNKIPFIKRLKLREVITFKGLYGQLSDGNNPFLDESLVQFPVDENGENLSFIMDKGVPYMEASVGISNIFKVIRVDMVQRLTYKDLPNVPELFGVKGLGLRVRAVVEF